MSVMFALGLLRPQLLRWLYVGWMVAVFPIGWLISRVVLALMFYVVFTFVAMQFRFLGRDALERRSKPNAETYWKPKPPARDVRGYFRQF